MLINIQTVNTVASYNLLAGSIRSVLIILCFYISAVGAIIRRAMQSYVASRFAVDSKGFVRMATYFPYSEELDSLGDIRIYQAYLQLDIIDFCRLTLPRNINSC